MQHGCLWLCKTGEGVCRCVYFYKLGFSQTCLGFTENGPKKWKHLVSSKHTGQRRVARLVRADRIGTITQITTGYNCRNTSLNVPHTEPGSRWRPHQLPATPVNSSRTLRIQITLAHHCWIIKDVKGLDWWVSISAATFRWQSQNVT